MQQRRGYLDFTVDKFRNQLLLLISAFALCNAAGYAQRVAEPADTAGDYAQLERYAENIYAFSRAYPQEKVYLHMDNRSYYVGDTIFFKAYVMHAATHRLSNISRVLYVELLGENGVEVDHKKLKIEGGMCAGSFTVGDGYRTGYYEIRAYTRNMINFGREAMPWINIHMPIAENKLHPYAITDDDRLSATHSPEPLLREVFATPFWQQSIVEDATHCQFSRVFPIYMRPEKAGQYKKEMDWYPMHSALAMPREVEEELRDDSLRIAFYPEGGALVAGVTSCVAIDVHDQWGREQEVRGYVVEGRDTVATFETETRGRGTFDLLPKRGRRYVAHVTYRGRQYRYRLPDVVDEGAVLSVVPPIKGGDAAFTVATTRSQAEPLGWTLMCRGALTAFDTLNVMPGVARTVILRDEQLQGGVNQLTLYSTRGEVLAERLFFVCPKSEPARLLLTTSPPDTLRPFEEVTLDFQCNASNGYFSQANFSIAVTDADERDATFDTGSLWSELLLSSDLKGFIKDVNSYFTHTNDTVMARDIDLLMRVQGWRRYEWTTMAGAREYVHRYAPEQGLLLEGRVVSDLVSREDFIDASKYKPYGNLAMRVEMRDPLIVMDDTFAIDSLGRFSIDLKKDFFGEVPMTISLFEPDGKVRKEGFYSRLKFAYPVIERAFSPSTTPYNYYQTHSPEEDWERTMVQNVEWQGDFHIDNVDVKKRRKRTSEINLDAPDIVVDYYKEWNRLIDRGIPNANYYDCADCYMVEIGAGNGVSDSEANNEGSGDVAIDPAEHNFIRMHYTLGRSRLWGRVARLPDSIFVYDKRQGEGRRRRYQAYLMPKTINIYTNLASRDPMGTPIDANTESRAYVVWKPEYHKRSLSPKKAPYLLHDGVRHTYCEGYSRVVSFYHRDYGEELPPDTADYRRTLYWNPSVTTSMTGKAELTFYNNARTKHLHIRAEGVTRYGELFVFDSEKQ